MNFSPRRWRSAYLEIYIRRTPYRIIAGSRRDASLALMTERSRIFTFNIIEPRRRRRRRRRRRPSPPPPPPPPPLPLERASECTVCWPFSIRARLETAQFSRRDCRAADCRGHAFLSSRCANTLACERARARASSCSRDGIASIDRPKEDLVNYRRTEPRNGAAFTYRKLEGEGINKLRD